MKSKDSFKVSNPTIWLNPDPTLYDLYYIGYITEIFLAFQFNDQYGEVCPANWQPGEDTMVPKPKESKAYFEKANKA